MKLFLKNITALKVLFFAAAFCIVYDAARHKGMIRVLLPKTFPDAAVQCPTALPAAFNFQAKKWIKAVNSNNALTALPLHLPGIETDIYFNAGQNKFEVRHDPGEAPTGQLDSILQFLKQHSATAGIWLDIKNLDSSNMLQAAQAITVLRDSFSLEGRIIIESPQAQCLQPFVDNNFFTSFYAPYFNPYLVSDAQLTRYADSIRLLLAQYPVHAVSGYYYQVNFLKAYLPGYPVLSWFKKNEWSIPGYLLYNKLAADTAIKIILQPL
ncbi:MAG TPA: hypothetical protein PKC39_00475 [Ferruginibacter sp.]|nr:hypothetical protein [Ferruginibacter sp.]HMP19405.1 hypothetical protein [Ferruginibacter sp.]